MAQSQRILVGFVPFCGWYKQVVRHIKTEKNETDYTNNFIDFINFL